ncbi:hypothetical protein ABN028_26675 [Actinopolymorpha sp. B17G11]|uniref:hypothetical protein n=1 Tax=Actinopolymorpha sp. B17G11 TaxID=3160861 RepID=UPI0032E50B64
MGGSRRRTREQEVAEFRDALTDSDSQVRLNAAVRLAYLDCADGLAELVTGLSHPEGAIRLVQVPEALSLLGEPGLSKARRLLRDRGPVRLAAAKTLTYAGAFDGVVEVIIDSLHDADRTTRTEAASLVGELGPPAVDAFDALTAAFRDQGEELAIALPALASAGRQRALPILRQALGHDTSPSPVRTSAMRALASLGTRAADTHPMVASALDDHSAPLRERLTAAHTLTRIGPSGEAVAATIGTTLPQADRWLRIGLLRALSHIAPGYPRRPEASQEWPWWESRSVHTPRPQRVEPVGRACADLLGTLVAHLDHDDSDVRRNAALAMAFFGRFGRTVAGDVRAAPRLPEPLRGDLLRRLLPRAFHESVRPSPLQSGRYAHLDPAAWQWGLYFAQPDVDLDAIAADCERQWAQADGGDLDYQLAVPKWQFLHYLVERHGVVLHGSATPGIDVLHPRSRSWGGGRTSGQPGVFAVDHALMAMYFGIIDRSKVSSMSNGVWWGRNPDGTPRRCFSLAVEYAGLAARPFVDATLYVLPSDTFTMMGELTSLVPVKPLARLAVAQEDYPFLEDVWGNDVGPLASQFGGRFAFLRDVGAFPAKRSVPSGSN